MQRGSWRTVVLLAAGAGACDDARPVSMVRDATLAADDGPAMDAVAKDARDAAAAADAPEPVDATVPLPLPPEVALDRYGGAMTLPIANTSGFFAVSHAYGRDWLVTPDGHAFVSFGVNHVDATGDEDRGTHRAPYAEWTAAHFASRSAWADDAAARMRAWTFNTLGAWSDDGLFAARLPRTPILGFAGDGWFVGRGPDVFDPAWEAETNASARRQIGGDADDPNVVGWFLDNELRWGPDWRSSADLLDVFVALPASAPGKRALVEFARTQFANVAAFNAAFGTSLGAFDDLAMLPALRDTDAGWTAGTPAAQAFRHAWTGLVAERYFAVTAAAVRAADAHHLVLGCRFVSWIAPPAVVAAAGRHVDVLSVNHYEVSSFLHDAFVRSAQFAYRVDTDDWLAAFAAASGRPVLISEFGARASDSGLPNTYPPPLFQVVWHTQAERADALQRYGVAMAEHPFLVGIHWFEWVDEPPGGRFDGEDSNWGLVDLQDRAYTLVTDRAVRAGPRLSYARAR